MCNYCPKCGNKVNDGMCFCPNCGAPLDPNQYFSQSIPVNENNPAASYYANGQPQIVINNITPKKYVSPDVYIKNKKEINKWIAFALCFILGFWGAHKFYEGKIGLGILYLFTGGLFGIGWLVDWIVILTKTDPYYV